jgi:hypothetical protein
MPGFLKRLLRRAEPPRATIVHPALGAALVGHDVWPGDLVAADAAVAAVQVDGDPAPGRPVADARAPQAPRDVFVAPAGLGLPGLALVNVRDPRARIQLWELDAPTPADGVAFARRVELAFPPGRGGVGWQVRQLVPLPRLQCAVALCHDDDPRTAWVAVLDLASRRLRELGVAEPDPFTDGPGGRSIHVAALQAGPDAVLVRWHSGRLRLGRWGDVALEDRVVLFTPRERDGLAVLALALDDGNIRSWGLRGTTLWLHTIDGRLRPTPREHVWSLALDAVL